ncbi:unnamed protein product, partial [Enterobius vermicularis]|uniref:Ig-like domain-containing protein n=1 Tax=Enterobius vermicularis TaxID=51028 RepID=A0A0N4UUV6_ENTVE
ASIRSNSVSVSFDVFFCVTAAPWVTTEHTYLPVELDQQVNISCRYDGEPSPEVTWFFNAFVINDATDEKFKKINRYAVRRSNYSETIIQINNINEDHFGDYTCRISNNYGTDEKTIYVSGRPGPPRLSLSDQVLKWEIESVNAIIMYRIKYRTSHDDTWQDSIEIRAQKGDRQGNTWKSRYDLSPSKFKPGNDYELQVQARNSLGWGSLARSYIVYKVPDAETESGEHFFENYSFFRLREIQYLGSIYRFALILSFIASTVATDEASDSLHYFSKAKFSQSDKLHFITHISITNVIRFFKDILNEPGGYTVPVKRVNLKTKLYLTGYLLAFFRFKNALF